MTQQVNLNQDIEFSGRLGKALNHRGGAEFALMLACLQQDYLARVKFEQQDNPLYSEKTIAADLQHYPVQPLYAEEKHWRQMQVQKQLWQHHQQASARLYEVIHPAPLGLKDQTQFIDPVIIDNAGINNSVMQQQQDIDIDETSLFELLNRLQPKTSEQSAA
ncbi:VC2046/SO_2500 family protein [Neptunicella marina]|uniref:Ribosomal S4P n=1 Tax=Neptunicella marina TaxID=2125989 RepID=A0A8J6IQY8_9ALTE|nr:VC2046/SO_2500 family protein [Neptunicella marina]MBC3764265.1 hypothetical protein [Neptunicella marina]